MPEKEKIDINIPITEQINKAGERKGLVLGDGFVNPLEKKLLDDIIVKHGEAIAGTREAMNADFSNLLEDVADLSEGNQRQLREVSEMLGETLAVKDEALQMNYALFQKILMFQRDNQMKLTGIVDKNLHTAIKEKMGKKSAENPGQTAPSQPATKSPEVPEEKPTPSAEAGTIPAPSIPPIPRAIPIEPQVPSIPENNARQYEGQNERILPPVVPNSPNQVITPSTPVVPENSSPSEAILPPPIPGTVGATPSVVRATPVASPQTSQEIPEFGRKVGMFERNKIVKGAENSSDILSQTTSAEILSSDESTKSVTKILNKYLARNPEKRQEMIQALRTQIGNFSRPLTTPEEVGAFQQLFYLAYPERFTNEIGYIDGEYGPRTNETYMKDIFVMGGWQEKIEGNNGLLKKSPEEISTYISSLSEFEKDLLKRHYALGNVDENTSPESIKQAQLGLVLSGVNVPVNGIQDEKMSELLEYPELAKSLGEYVQNNYLRHAGGANTCGASVGGILKGFGIKGLPTSGRDGQNWNEILDARPDQFIKVKINSPDEAKPGGILCFDGGGTRPRSYMAIRHGHVEVVGTNHWYYHYVRSPRWGGSAGANVTNSRFTGYVYYPRKKSRD